MLQILDRYVAGEITRPFVMSSGLLAVIFIGYSATAVLDDPGSALLSPGTLTSLIGLNGLITLEVLLPTAFFLSALVALTRMYRESEMAALHAAGITDGRIMGALLKLAIVVALVTGTLSLEGRPWAYHKIYQLEATVEEGFDFRGIAPKDFVELPGTGYVLYAGDVDKKTGVLRDILLTRDSEDNTEMITAREAVIRGEKMLERHAVEFRDGVSYVLDHLDGPDLIQQSATMVINLAETEAQAKYRRKAASSWRLARSADVKDLTEFQWRLIVPLNTVLLALLALPLARSGPRQMRMRGLVSGLIAYAVVFSLETINRDLMEDGVIPVSPGLGLSVAALAAAIVVFHRLPAWQRRWARR